jgi:hypothetical protein
MRPFRTKTVRCAETPGLNNPDRALASCRIAPVKSRGMVDRSLRKLPWRQGTRLVGRQSRHADVPLVTASASAATSASRALPFGSPRVLVVCRTELWRELETAEDKVVVSKDEDSRGARLLRQKPASTSRGDCRRP